MDKLTIPEKVTLFAKLFRDRRLRLKSPKKLLELKEEGLKMTAGDRRKRFLFYQGVWKYLKAAGFPGTAVYPEELNGLIRKMFPDDIVARDEGKPNVTMAELAGLDYGEE